MKEATLSKNSEGVRHQSNPADCSIIVDTMGGDFGPEVILEGVTQALPQLQRSTGELILLGDEEGLRSLLSKREFKALKNALDTEGTFSIRLIHAPETISMEDSIRAIRQKPNATINVGCEIAAKSYRSQKNESNPLNPAAFISAGHSGAVMASALLKMGRLPGLERPAIAVKLPSLSEDGCILLDVGANVDCKPEHLRDFAIMGAIYAQVERKNPALPTIGLLANGEEKKKGNELTRASASLIETLKCFHSGSDAIGHYIGYTEGKEIFKGGADVVVADGFVGNVVLKSAEGLGSAVTSILKSEARKSPLSLLGFLLSASVFSRFKKRLDYAEYGGAPLLGVAGYVFICHGRSNARAIKNAILRAHSAVKDRYVERLEEALEKVQR